MNTCKLNTFRLYPICKKYSGLLEPHIRRLHEARAKDYPVNNSNSATQQAAASYRLRRQHNATLCKYKQKHGTVPHLINLNALTQSRPLLLTRASALC